MKVVKLVMVVDDYEIGDPVEKSPWTYYYVSIGILLSRKHVLISVTFYDRICWHDMKIK